MLLRVLPFAVLLCLCLVLQSVRAAPTAVPASPGAGGNAPAAESSAPDPFTNPPAGATQPGESAAPPPATPRADGLVPLNPQGTVLLDASKKRLLLKTRVVLREGVLEMLVRKARTKEHESILAVDTEAYLIHAGLLAIGAQPGSPATFDKEFKPPTGQRIDLFVNWTDAEGKAHREPAQSWIRHVTRRYFDEPLDALPPEIVIEGDSDLRYDEQNKLLLYFGTMPDAERDRLLKLSRSDAFHAAIKKLHAAGQPRQMQGHWVFAGSRFFQQKDGKLWYEAEDGNLVCVANFADSLLDLAQESSASAGNLLYEPYTDRIPPLETPVTLEMVPAVPGKQ